MKKLHKAEGKVLIVRLRKAALLFLFLAAAGLIVSHLLLAYRVQDPAFKVFAEKKAGEFFKARVQVGKIRVRLFYQVILSPISLEYENGANAPLSRIHIQQLIFRYDGWNLLTQNLKMPSSVLLKTPEINLRNGSFFYDFFRNLRWGKGSGSLSNFQLEQGSVRFRIPFLKSMVVLENLRGSVRPAGRGKASVDFRAALQGARRGSIHIHGIIDGIQKTHRLLLDFESVEFDPSQSSPVQSVSGSVRWENDGYYFDSLEAHIRGWELFVKGRLEQLDSLPVLELHWTLGGKKRISHGYLIADHTTRILEGQIHGREGQSCAFYGSVRREAMRWIFSDMWIESGFKGSGWMDFTSGAYYLDFAKASQRYSISSSIKNFDFKLNLRLNHADFYGLDIVTDAVIRFHPVIAPWNTRLWKWNGSFKTRYFILEYAPFNDFEGTFDLTPYGIKNLSGSWGNVFDLEGDIKFRESGPEVLLLVKTAGFDLRNIHEFANKPLPRKIAGLLEGRLKIEGPARGPVVTGNFVVKEGQLGRLHYDRGIVQFQGMPPYLKLQDSHIFRGRTTFLLNGALDLSLSNILSGIRIETHDNFILWKGLELSSNDGGGEWAMRIPAEHLPGFAIKTSQAVQAGIGAEANHEDDEKYLVLGPALKF